MSRPPTVARALSSVVPASLARSWVESWPRWFGAERVPLPRAPEKRHLALVETPLGRVVAKRERTAGWKGSLAAFGARPLRSLRAFRAAQALLARELATPEPLAVLECRALGTCEALLVTRYVEGSGPWDHLQAGIAPERLVETLARALARLHERGFRHRDMKASNLLLRAEGAELALFWTDLDGLRHLGSVPAALRARDLARLSMSFESAEARRSGVRADLWPTLVHLYLQETLGRAPTRDEHGHYLARTRRWAERAIRRNLASGRPVL